MLNPQTRLSHMRFDYDTASWGTTMADDEWFYSGPEGRFGPISFDELESVCAHHPHASGIFVWHSSLPNWTRAVEFEPLRADGYVARPSPLDAGFFRGNDDDTLPPARRFSIIGVLIGIALIVSGAGVLCFDLTGQLASIIEVLGIDHSSSGGSLGAGFVAVGLFVMWVTRYPATSG
jgi:hypothetical protein